MSAASFVYFIQAGDSGPIKIGFTHKVRRRLQALQTGAETPLVIRKITAGGASLESDLHRDLAAHRLHGEWFRPHADVIAAMNALPENGSDTDRLPLKQLAPKTPLHRWRRKNALTISHASAVVGISRGLISGLENGKQTPCWTSMRAIFEATGGEITPNDFADFLLPIKQKQAA